MHLKNFKIESEAGDSYHIKSPMGRMFTVPKNGLKPEAHQMIKKMCGGGEVKNYDEGGDVAPSPVGTNTVLASDAPADVATPAPAPAAAAPQPAPVDPLVQSGQSTESLLNQEEQAANNFATSQDAANKTIQGAYANEINQLNQMPTAQAIADSYKQKDQALLQSYMDNKIDPNRYMKNMSTGSRIMAVMASALGGAGAGRNGTNLAAQNIQTAINNDILAQQNDQSKSLNLYKMNREAMKDDQQSLLATQNQMLTGVQAKVAQAGAMTQNADAHFRASQLINQIEQQKIQNRLRLGLLTQGTAQGPNGQMQASTSQANPLNLVPMMVPAEHQKQAITELGQAQAANQNEDSILKLFDQASRDTRPATGLSKTAMLNTIPNLPSWTGVGYKPPSIKGLDVLFDPLIHDNEGRINELEQKHVQENFPNWGDSDETVAQKRQSLQSFITHKKSAPTAATFGINPNMFASTATKTTPEIQYKDGLPYMKVPGGWQRVNK